MIVIVIIGILAAVAVPKVIEYTEKARLANDIQALSAVNSAFEVAFTDDEILTVFDSTTLVANQAGVGVYSLAYIYNNFTGTRSDKEYGNLQKMLYYATKNYLGENFFKSRDFITGKTNITKWSSEILRSYSADTMGIRITVQHAANSGAGVMLFTSLRASGDDSRLEFVQPYYTYRSRVIGIGDIPPNGWSSRIKWKKVELQKK